MVWEGGRRAVLGAWGPPAGLPGVHGLSPGRRVAWSAPCSAAQRAMGDAQHAMGDLQVGGERWLVG